NRAAGMSSSSSDISRNTFFARGRSHADQPFGAWSARSSKPATNGGSYVSSATSNESLLSIFVKYWKKRGENTGFGDGHAARPLSGASMHTDVSSAPGLVGLRTAFLCREIRITR